MAVPTEFPAGFTWGTATASYQIEGSPHADGKGLSIWDTFTRQPGMIDGGDTGDNACDSYRRWRDDLALLVDLGVTSYRFSVSWPRVVPFGRGAVNDAGLAYYERMVDDLLDAGIEPAVTLFHWDLPQALQDRGGWADRGTAEAFADYAGVLFDRLGNRVPRWFTLNEPYVFVVRGYLFGAHAPGIADLAMAARAHHHALLAHGLAVQRFRSSAATGRIGLVQAEAPIVAGTEEDGIEAAVTHARDLRTRMMLDPVLGRGYPGTTVRRYEAAGAALPIQPGDLETIAAPIDELGVNYYTRELVGPPGGDPEDQLRGYRSLPPRTPTTDMGWEIVPESLADHLRWLDATYDALPPLLITENGMAEGTGPDADGRIDDQRRIAYLRDHLASLATAIADGVDVRGYFLWSLLDNFEWAKGYAKRFGIVWVDHTTGERLPKASFAWYRDFIAASEGEES